MHATRDYQVRYLLSRVHGLSCTVMAMSVTPHWNTWKAGR